MKLLKLAGLSLCAGIAALSFDGFTSISSVEARQKTLDQVLSDVRAERQASAADNRERLARFVRERDQQRARLTQVRNQKNAAKDETVRLEGVRDQNRVTLEELSAELDQKNGEFKDLFGAARSAANELAKQVDSSLISAEFPGRSDALRDTATSDTLPAIEELEYLWLTYLQEMTEQAKISTFDAGIVSGNGQPETRSVTRVGPFIAMADSKFLVYKQDDDDNEALIELAKQPGGGRTGLAGNVEGSTAGNYVRGIVDPSLGVLLDLTVEEPTLDEYRKQGGLVGNIIIGMTIIGILLGLYKLVTLTLVNGQVSGQARSKKISKGNPLGRVMMAYQDTDGADTETVALKLDDAVLKEIPKLEGGLNFIKVLAAVAPLMGLLGTVIGMIQTSQAITLFGTGDPQIMAGGISSALITTVLGLIGAIPLLFLHAFASGAAKSVSQTLEEKAAGIIAEHAEGRRG